MSTPTPQADEDQSLIESLREKEFRDAASEVTLPELVAYYCSTGYTVVAQASLDWLERQKRDIDRLQALGDELVTLLAEARNERDMYKQQRADWKAAYEGTFDRSASV